LNACRSGAAQAAAALGRELEGEFTVAPAESAQRLDANALPAAWNGPGLILIASSQEGAVAFLISPEGDLVSEWSRQAEEAGQDRLLALARKLAAHLFPGDLDFQRFGARWVDSLAAAAAACGVAPDASAVFLPVTQGSQQSALWVLWPLANVDALLAPAVESHRGPAAVPQSEAPSLLGTPVARRPSQERILYETIEEVLPFLPVYSRSLLKIRTPVRVTLASTRLPVKKIVELAPGSLIQFPKSCEETLELEVGDHVIARGEAVKVGEKFGLRVTAMVLPGERFAPIAPKPKKK
jgi:flagellar motor switch/type III secretory pathway protein FliN